MLQQKPEQLNHFPKWWLLHGRSTTFGFAAISQFGTTFRIRSLLYSLADFCYGVRREVFDVVGEADESYGPGPYWEMDFNVRAARAGFQGLWACASYVYGAPATQRRSAKRPCT